MGRIAISSGQTTSTQEAEQNAITDMFSLGSGIPTSGTYARGSLVINTLPLPGAPFMWRCVTAGTPGTWEPIYVQPDDFIPTIKSFYLP